MADVAAIVVAWRHQKPWCHGRNHRHGNVSLKYSKLEIGRTTCIRYLNNKSLRDVHGGYMTCMQKEKLKALLYATVANWQFKWARPIKYWCGMRATQMNIILIYVIRIGDMSIFYWLGTPKSETPGLYKN